MKLPEVERTCGLIPTPPLYRSTKKPTLIRVKRKFFFNPIDTEIFFDACVPGGCEKSHPPENQFCFYKTKFFLHEVKFCINSALFLCTVLFSSSILMNFSNLGKKWLKIWTFLRIELQTSYVPQKKAEII